MTFKMLKFQIIIFLTLIISLVSIEGDVIGKTILESPTPILTPTITPTQINPTTTPIYSPTMVPPTLTPTFTYTPLPTNTPIPTNTPTIAPTPTFTNTPTNTPTETSTPTKTPKPTFTPTPRPTFTPTPLPLKVHLYLNKDVYTISDLLDIDLVIVNPQKTFHGSLAIVLMAMDRIFFYPWSEVPQFIPITVPQGDCVYMNLMLFQVPPNIFNLRVDLIAILFDSNSNLINGDMKTFYFVVPTPTPTPIPTATPVGAEGYVTGYARVEISNLPPRPHNEKEIIFCLGNTRNENWVNVRHRSRNGSTYQLKGGLAPYTWCGDEVNYWHTQPACNGIWEVWWNGYTGEVRVLSPCNGEETIRIPGGRFAFDYIGEGGSCGGYIRTDSPARVRVLEMSGEWGYSIPCPPE